MDPEAMLVSLYVPADNWRGRAHAPSVGKPGPPASPSASEVLTPAIVAQWPRWRGERDCFRFADAHLRECLPNLVTHGQFNRLLRVLGPELKAFQRHLTATPADGSKVYYVLDTTLIPAVVLPVAPSTDPA